MNVASSPVAENVAVEQARLTALDRYDVLDTPGEEAFDRITRLAQKIFQVPIALVSVIDGHRQWYKSGAGIGAPEAPRRQTFCNYTIQEPGPLIVPDAHSDPRFAQNPYVLGEPFVRFYAGMPLKTHDGHNIGTLCIVDTKAREFGAEQVDILYDLARMAMDELELRLISSTDSLTGALSRRAFREEVERAVLLALRHHHDLSVITLDLDRFSAINDAHGHASGDKVLREVVKACAGELRKTDLIGRVGGEEFSVLLPHTGSDGALDAAEKMREAVERLRFALGGRLERVTASFGAASLSRVVGDVDTLLKSADAAMREAKGAGRNRSVAWRGEDAQQSTNRRRVLKGGQILFNGRNSTIDCTVRSLSEDGAGVDVFDSVGVPKIFDLAIKADSFDRPCRVTSRTDRHIEVEFL